MDRIIAPFLARTEDHLRPADRDAFRKILSKSQLLRQPDSCECLSQWIMKQAHLILSTIFSEVKTDDLHEIKSQVEWQMTSLPSKKRRVMENPNVATIRSYLPQSNYEQLKWLYVNACHMFKQQGWAVDMSQISDSDNFLHDVYDPGAHMILAVLFGDMDASMVVQNLEQFITQGDDCYCSDEAIDYSYFYIP